MRQNRRIELAGDTTGSGQDRIGLAVLVAGLGIERGDFDLGAVDRGQSARHDAVAGAVAGDLDQIGRPGRKRKVAGDGECAGVQEERQPQRQAG